MDKKIDKLGKTYTIPRLPCLNNNPTNMHQTVDKKRHCHISQQGSGNLAYASIRHFIFLLFFNLPYRLLNDGEHA